MGQIRRARRNEGGCGHFVSRRALACGAPFEPDKLDRDDTNSIGGDQFVSATVVCTLADIGDPRFRVWLCGTLGSSMVKDGKIHLEITT